MQPLMEEFGRATTAAAIMTESTIGSSNFAVADAGPTSDEAEAVEGAAATTASVIVHHGAAPDSDGQKHMGEEKLSEEKPSEDQVAVEIVSSDHDTEGDNEGNSPSGKSRSEYLLICEWKIVLTRNGKSDLTLNHSFQG